MLQSVYVGNLPASATEAKLKELFEGPPLNCEVRRLPPFALGSNPVYFLWQHPCCTPRCVGHANLCKRATACPLCILQLSGVMPDSTLMNVPYCGAEAILAGCLMACAVQRNRPSTLSVLCIGVESGRLARGGK